MKPALFVIMFALMCGLFAVTSNVNAQSSQQINTPYTFTYDLKQGDTGMAVTALQNFLYAQGFLTATARGYFGSLTAGALSQYQKTKGITPAIGYFGPKTRKMVNTDYLGILPNGNSQGSGSGSGVIQDQSQGAVSDLYGTCFADKTGVEIGESDTWQASASGGNGSYSYSWIGDAPLSGKTGSNPSVTYTTTGMKNGSVKISSGKQTITVSCGSVYVDEKSQQPLQSSAASIPDPSLGQSDPDQSSTQSNADTITDSEIEPYLTAIGEIVCEPKATAPAGTLGATGSGSLWRKKYGYMVLTNKHVTNVTNRDYCLMVVPDHLDIKAYANARLIGYKITGSEWWYLDDKLNYSEGKASDKAALKVIKDSIGGDSPAGLNYKLEDLPFCPNSLPANSPVVAVGFPAKAQLLDDLIHVDRIVTFGKFDSYTEPSGTNLPGKDYVVTTPIDHGNSGGLAFSKVEGKLCVLGIPTAKFTTGNMYSIIQNINNVFYNFP